VIYSKIAHPINGIKSKEVSHEFVIGLEKSYDNRPLHLISEEEFFNRE